MRTAVDGTFAPHAMPKLGGGGYEGFNIDLANEIAKRLKRKIDDRRHAVLRHRSGAAWPGPTTYVAAPTTVTKERAENMLFTEGYLNTDFQFLIKKGAPKVDKLEDLKGKTVSVNKGSAYDSWARELEAKIGWKVESFGTQTDAVQAVLAGRADANVAGNTVIAWAVKNNPQLELSYLLLDRPGLGRGLPQGFRRAAQADRERDRMHEARRHHREDAREMVRHQAGAGLRRGHGVPRATACRACRATIRPSTNRD